VPTWAKDLKIGTSGINARVETVREKPMFRTAFKKRRCIVPMNGYFEWKKLVDGTKQPYFIHAPDRSALLCAGLWEAWKPRDQPDADWIRTFAVITGDPGKISGDIHDRQPVILPGDRLEAWLDGTPDDAYGALLDLAPDLTYYAVSKSVGSVKNQGQQLVEPIEV
jgi:putative SOS response-associated peptidase YedK